jgi:peptide/nickel transport system substrate-binding protein
VGAVLALALPLALAGCGAEGDDDGDEGGNAGQVLRVDIGAEPASMDPLTATDGQRHIYIEESVTEAMTSVGGREGGVEPVLAESWEAEGTNWIFHLREGVTFHDGSEMTSADVVASFERAQDEGSQIGASRLLPETEVVAVDDYTVEWRMPTVDPTVPARAAAIFIVPEEYAPVSDQRLRDELPGTGPYQLESWEKGQGITLVAYEDYWSGEVPPIERVEMTFNEEAAVRFAAIQSGEIDAAMGMPIDLATDDVKTVATPVPEMLALKLNNLRGPLTDQRLREAINLTIDRELLIEQMFGGYAEPAKGQLVTSAVMGYSESMTDFEFDREAAQQLVQDAGAEGTEISMVATRGRFPNDAETAEAIAGMLEEAGFVVELDIPTYEEWLEKQLAPSTDITKAPDIVMVLTGNEMFDLVRQYQYLQCGGSVATMCIEEVDALLDEAAALTEPEERQALYDQVWPLIAEQAAYAFVLSPQLISFTSDDLNWTPGAKAVARFQDMSLS